MFYLLSSASSTISLKSVNEKYFSPDGEFISYVENVRLINKKRDPVRSNTLQ